MWLDRLLGEPVSALPSCVEPGRYWINASSLTFNGHTRNISGVLVADGSELCQLGHETLHFVVPEKSLLAQSELFSRAVETLDADMEKSARLGSPLMPAAVIDDQSHLLPFEKELLEVVNKGHLHQISLRPRLDLHYEDEVTDIARAKRLAKGALVHLASHSECWQRQTLNGVIPKKVLARFSQDDYNIYENRVYARLLDNIDRHLRLRIEMLKQLQATLSQALEFYEATDINHLLRTEICRLWGQTYNEAGTNKASKLLDETIKTLEFIFKTVSSLKQTGLYLLVNRNSQVSGSLHLTNILSHDPHYRHLAILWDLLGKVRINARTTPEERYRQNLFLSQAYSRYAGLALRHALHPYMAGQDEAEWAGRTLKLKRAGMEWMLVSSVAGADSSREETLLTLVPWLSFTAPSKNEVSLQKLEDDSSRVIAWPALDKITNLTALDGNWIALSPFDLYCVERFGNLVDRILYRQVLKAYGSPLLKIPSKALVLASDEPALHSDDLKHQLVVREALPNVLFTELTQALRSNNATHQASMLALRQQEILALQKCPVCSAPVKVIFQEPSGFRANCDQCRTERYLRHHNNRLAYQQKVEGKIDFRTLGRRAISLP